MAAVLETMNPAPPPTLATTNVFDPAEIRAVIQFADSVAVETLLVHFQDRPEEKHRRHFFDGEFDCFCRPVEAAIAGRAIALSASAGEQLGGSIVVEPRHHTFNHDRQSKTSVPPLRHVGLPRRMPGRRCGRCAQPRQHLSVGRRARLPARGQCCIANINYCNATTTAAIIITGVSRLFHRQADGRRRVARLRERAGRYQDRSRMSR